MVGFPLVHPASATHTATQCVISERQTSRFPRGGFSFKDSGKQTLSGIDQSVAGKPMACHVTENESYFY